MPDVTPPSGHYLRYSVNTLHHTHPVYYGDDRVVARLAPASDVHGDDVPVSDFNKSVGSRPYLHASVVFLLNPYGLQCGLPLSCLSEYVSNEYGALDVHTGKLFQSVRVEDKVPAVLERLDWVYGCLTGHVCMVVKGLSLLDVPLDVLECGTERPHTPVIPSRIKTPLRRRVHVLNREQPLGELFLVPDRQRVVLDVEERYEDEFSRAQPLHRQLALIVEIP